jgi:menaquinone-dependent protoporphyrinogen oxidase
MKTLILYATKYGAAQEIAKRIAAKMEGTVVHDLKQSGVPSLDGFDCVVVGGSLYAGMLRKEAKTFLTDHKDTLRGKKLGLFLCGMDGSKESEYFKNNIPEDLLSSAKATAFLGGIFDPKKAGFLERAIMKAVAKQAEYSDIIDNPKIITFVEGLKK